MKQKGSKMEYPNCYRLYELQHEHGIRGMKNLSEKTGLSCYAIKNILKGRSTEFDKRNIEILAKYFKVVPEYIKGESDFRNAVVVVTKKDDKGEPLQGLYVEKNVKSV